MEKTGEVHDLTAFRLALMKQRVATLQAENAALKAEIRATFNRVLAGMSDEQRVRFYQHVLPWFETEMISLRGPTEPR